MVKITIANATAQLSDLADQGVIDRINKDLSYTKNSNQFQQFHRPGWDGIYRLLTKRMQFPVGCIPRVRRLLDALGQTHEVVEQRDFTFGPGLSWRGPPLYDYQDKIVATALDKRLGVVRAATGAGKSLMIARIIAELNIPTVLYVVSTDLLDQMHETLSKVLTEPIGLVGAGNCRIERITVCSAWTPGKLFKEKSKKLPEEDSWRPEGKQAAAIREMVTSARLVILDEAQFAAAESIKVILQNSTAAAFRYGLSGTPWRMDGDDLLLEAAFGPVIYDLNASTLIDQGYLVQPHILFKDIPKLETSLTGQTYTTVKKEYLFRNAVRNQILVRGIEKFLELGRKTLVLFKEHSQGEQLRDLLPPDVRHHYVTGRLTPEERKFIRDDFLSGNVQLILASTVYDQGVDLPPLDALVLGNGGKSTAKALQRVGRVIRSFQAGGKKNALVLDTFDQAPYLKEHAFLRYQIFATEPRFQIRYESAFNSYLGRKGFK